VETGAARRAYYLPISAPSRDETDPRRDLRAHRGAYRRRADRHAGRYLRPLSHDHGGTGIREQLEGVRLVARLAADGSAGTAWTRSDGDGPERTIWWSFLRTTSQPLLQRELAVYLASPAGRALLCMREDGDDYEVAC
jgi:hypothetical protein